MDGIHDIGGMDGFGPVERDETTFHAPWERRAFGLALATDIAGTTDEFRHSMERLDPGQYLTNGYFGRWLAATEIRLRDRDLLDSDEVDGRCGSSEVRPRAVASIGVPDRGGDGGPQRTLDRPPAYTEGQQVRALDLHPVGHTRLPRYVRGHRGVVASVLPAFVFPDTNAHGHGEDPQYVYSVRFRAADLWGAGDHLVHVDLFEPYLEAA